MTKERKVLLIVGVILICFGVLYRFNPIPVFFSESDSVLIKKEKISRYKNLISRKKQIEARLASFKARLKASDDLFFNSPSASLAAVEVQNAINAAAASLEVSVKSMDVMKEVALGKDSGYVAVPVRLSADMNIQQLKDILVKLESFPKYLTIRDLACSVSDSKNTTIGVMMTVEGYMGKRAE